MDVFSEDKLNKIFKCYEGQDSNKIISRESTTLEFKASFSTSAIPRYAKTMAAFANRDGGYIIFGVKNNPRMVIGLKDNTFDEYDDEKFVPEKLTGKDLELKTKYLNLFNKIRIFCLNRLLFIIGICFTILFFISYSLIIILFYCPKISLLFNL